MEGWLNSLSEDWISQTQSSSPLTSRLPSQDGHGSLQDRTSKDGNRTHRSADSGRSLRATKYNEPSQQDVRAALAEQHLNNAGQTSSRSFIEQDDSEVDPVTTSMRTDTIQHHGTHIRKSISLSPPKNRPSPETLEWKRRLLGKDGSHGAPQDLFSPIKLENMFRPPSPQGTPGIRGSARGHGHGKGSSIPFPAHLLHAVDKEAREGADAPSIEDPGHGQLDGADYEPPQRKGFMVDESRKGSVQTRDFLDEAERVMELIRARGNPDHDLTRAKRRAGESPDISDIEEDPADQSVMRDTNESTVEGFSRPPSRNGPRQFDSAKAAKLDPKVVEYLRGYAEPHELESIMNPSATSLDHSNRKVTSSGVDQSSARSSKHSVINYDLKIRITEDSERSQGELRSISIDESKSEDGSARNSARHHSTTGSGQSMNRTVGTGSTSRSDTKLVIAPQAVSHLVSGEIAGMTFDHTKQLWVKRKVTLEERIGTHPQPFSDDSTNDPFQNIPDLTVNETEELHMIRAQALDGGIAPRTPSNNTTVAKETVTDAEQGNAADTSHKDSRPAIQPTQDEERRDEVTNSKKVTRGDSREPLLKTVLRQNGPESQKNRGLEEGRDQMDPAHSGKGEQESAEEVEGEIQAHEGREPQGSGFRNKGRRKKRDVTITFSSPLVSRSFQIPAHSPSAEEEQLSGFASQLQLGMDSVLEGFQDVDSASFLRQSRRRLASSVFPQRSTFGQKSRRMSGGIASASRIVPDIVDQCQRIDANNTSISRRPSQVIALGTPGRSTESPNDEGQHVHPTPERLSHLTFYLSPLPDFTVNQLEENLALEVSRLDMGQAGPRPHKRSRALSIATLDLVRKLTDLEPYEPYWEHIRQLDLSKSGLTALTGLADFCARVEKLDASHNRIRQLTGAPQSVRYLKITHNQLSSLTAYGHLLNLQYLDVSNNEIDNLQGLRGLVHLRELKADNNLISSLEGVAGLDGLMKLDISRNAFKTLDFADSTLIKLVELDARSNSLTDVRNLHHLPELARLDLDDNSLGRFNISGSTPLHSLHSLSLNANQLKRLDISMLPGLRSLHVDGNMIEKIAGLHSALHLERLAMRDQDSQAFGDTGRPSILDDCTEIQRLHLSGNLPPRFNSTVNYLNLQHLELATCGLRNLPATFGRTVTNVRVLNLNFNAISDITPLEGIVRLTKLMLVSNRVSRLRETVKILSGFRTLQELDLRYNPLTLGFYPTTNQSHRATYGFGAQGQDDPSREPEPFALPPADPDADQTYLKRLDAHTKMTRKISWMLLADRCRFLQVVDGLEFSRRKICRKDDEYKRLVELGIVREQRREARRPRGRRGESRTA